MKGYWLRVLTAFALLKVASRVMKDAESVLTTTHQVREIESEELPESVDG